MGFGGRLYDLKQSLDGRRLAAGYLAKSQYWDADRVHQMQYEKLLALLKHCYLNVPYYQGLFAEAGFSPERDFKTIEDLTRVPMMTKSTARAVKPHIISLNHYGSCVTDKTSGSTGHPFEISISHNQIRFEKATVWRHWSWTGYRFRTPMAVVRTYVPKTGQPLIKQDAVRNFRYYSAYHLNEGNAAEYLKDIRKFGARIIRGYPSSLFILARFKLQSGIELPGITAVLTASETLTDNQRTVIEEAFDARVFNWYGLAEQVVTANECEAHQGMHLNSEYGYWELQRRDYLPDDQRMIVGTNFRNYAMPLLRYETGDIALLADNDVCSCGRTLPLIKGIAGRKDDIITTPEGMQIPSVNFYSMFREMPAVERFQIIQWNRKDVELRVKSANLTVSDRNLILEELRRRLGEGIKLKITLNSEFERNPEGKRRPVMSMVEIKDT